MKRQAIGCGRRLALLPRPHRVHAHTEEPRQHALACTKQLPDAPHVARPEIWGAVGVLYVRTVNRRQLCPSERKTSVASSIAARIFEPAEPEGRSDAWARAADLDRVVVMAGTFLAGDR